MALPNLTLAGLFFSLQAFSSAFIRAAADRLVEERKTEAAKRYYRQAIQIDSSNWRAYKGLGDVYAKERRYLLKRKEKDVVAVEERRILKMGYQQNPKDAPLVYSLGRVEIFLGEVDEGLDLLAQACELRRFNDHYWWRLGVEQRKAGRYEVAKESFKYAQSLKNTPSIRKNIQWLEKQLNPPAASVSKKAPPSADLKIRSSEKMPLDELHGLMETF